MTFRRAGVWLGLWVLAASVVTAADQPATSAPVEPGLQDFIAARLAESRDNYREALRAYDRAVEEEPEVQEIRVRYAALLLEVGLVQKAVDVLDESGELDAYGQRVKALALARASASDETLLPAAEKALRSALGERPDDANVQLTLAQILEREGKVAEAEKLVAELRQARGGNPQLLAYEASLLRKLGRSQEAAELYAQCAGAGSGDHGSCRESLIQLLVEQGRSGEAGEVMLRWLDDSDLDQLLRAASLLYDGGRPEDALRAVRRVLTAAPDSKPARTLEAYILSTLGRYQEAVDRYQELLRSDRDNLDLLTAIAWATVHTGDLETARSWIGKAWEVVSSDSGSPRAGRVAVAGARVELYGGSVLRARDWLDRIVPSPEVGEQLAVLQAETYRREEAWSRGVAAMLRLQPRLEGRARRLARAFEAEFRLRMGDEAGGFKLLEPLLDASDADVVQVGLEILQRLERWQDVEQRAAAALERLPEARDLLFARAAALERLGRNDEADHIFRQLVARDPSDPVAANYLGYSLADRGESLEEALRLISAAVAADPENSAYLDSLGWVHYRMGDLDQAEFWLRRAADSAGAEGTILAHLGEVLLRQGKRDEGLQLLRKALDRGCEHPEHVRDLLGESGDAKE